MGAEGDKIFNADDIAFIANNTKSDKGDNCDKTKYDSDQELAALKDDLMKLYENKVEEVGVSNDLQKKAIVETNKTKLETIDAGFHNKADKIKLIEVTGDTIKNTDHGHLQASTYNNEIKDIFNLYQEDVGTAVEYFKEQLPHLQMEGEIALPEKRTLIKLPKNEKQLLMRMVQGKYGNMLRDDQGNELIWESLSKEQKKQLKELIAIVQSVNISSFFEAINAYEQGNKKGLEAIRQEFVGADIGVIMDAWAKEGALGSKYAQIADYRGLKKVEQRRLAKLTQKLLETTDTGASPDLAPMKSLLIHLQATTQQVNIDNKRGRKGAQYNERVQYAQAYLQSKNLETESTISDATAGSVLDILIADQDGDMSVDAEAYAHQDKGFKATKGWMYQLFHLKQAKKIREENKDARSYNRAVKNRRKEAAGKQKEVGANILFEGQLKRSLDTARKILNPDGTLSEGEVNTKVLQNLVGLVTQHYEQLVGKNVQIDQSSNILAVLQANRNSSATDILNNIFLKYPQTFGYVRGFLVEHHADAVNIFIDGASYGNIVIDAAKKNDEEEKNLESMNIPEPLLAKLDEEYGQLVAVLDKKVAEAKDQGFNETTIQNLQEQQENLNLNRPRRKMQLAADAMTVIASTINHAQGLGLATGVSAQLDNNWIQSIRLGGGVFQGIGGDSVAGTSLGVSLTFAGSRKVGDKGTLLYSLGAGTGANRNALGFLNGFDIGSSLGYEWTINSKTIASNLDPKAKLYFGAGFSASFLHGGIGPHLWLRNDKLLGLQEAEKKLLNPTKSLVEELLSKNCLEEATKQKKTLQVYIYEQLLAKKEGTSGDKKSAKLFRKTTNATLENASRNLAVGLMTYYTNPDFASLSSNSAKKAQVAESIARHHLLHWSMEHMEDLKQGLGSLHVSAFDIGLQIVASGPAPLKIVGGTLTRYKDGYRSEDYHSREQVEQIKEEGRDARELPGSFGSAIALYNKLLDAQDGTFTEDMKLTSTLVEHEGKQYPAVRIPPKLFEYLRNHDGGVVMHKLEMVFMKKDDEGAYISADAPSNLFVIPTSGKNEYQLVIGGVDGVRKGQEQKMDKNKVLYTQFDQIGDSIRTDGEGFAQRDAAVQEVSRDKYEEQYAEKFKQFMTTVNARVLGFFTKPTVAPSMTLDSFTTSGSPEGTVKLPIDPTMKFFGDTHTQFISRDANGTYLEVPLNGTIQVTKSTDPTETSPWKLDFVASQGLAQGLQFTYGEAAEAFTKNEVISSEGFNLEAVQPELIDYLKSRQGAEATLKWRYKDVKRTPNQDHHQFYKHMQANKFVEAATIAKKYMDVSTLVLDASETGKANLHTLYAELSRVDMTEFKDVENMPEAKQYAHEQLSALVATGRVSVDDNKLLTHIIDDVFDGKTPVTDFMTHQAEIERILKVKYVVEYNRNKNWDDPAYKLTYLLAPASVVDKTRDKALLARMKNEPIYEVANIRKDFMQKREQIFSSMDAAETIANIGTVQKNYLGLVFGYGDGVIDEKIIAHPPVMNFAGSVIPYDKTNATDKKHIQYFVDNTKNKEPEYLFQDMQGMITYLGKQLSRTDLTVKCRQELTAAQAIFESKKKNINEIASLWQTGKFLDGTLPVGIDSVTKDFAQTKYPKCVNDMIIAGPTKILPKIETEQQVTIPLIPVGGMKIEPYTFGKAHVTTRVIGHSMTKDARTINVLTSHGNLEKTYETVTVESTTQISDLDTYLAGLTPEQRDAFLAKLGTEIQPGIELNLGLGQGVQTYDGWVIDTNIWVIQDNSGTLPTMRLVNIVSNQILNTAVLSNREQSFIVKSNALAAQNLRKLGIIKKSPQEVHSASPIEERDPAQPIPQEETQSFGNELENQNPNGADVVTDNKVEGEILTAKDNFTPFENQESYLTSESVYGYTYQLGKSKDGGIILRVAEEGDTGIFTDVSVTDISKVNQEVANKLITVGSEKVFVDVFGKNVTIMPVNISRGEESYVAPNSSTDTGMMIPRWKEVPKDIFSPGSLGTMSTIQYKDTRGSSYIILNKELYKVNDPDSDNSTYEKMD